MLINEISKLELDLLLLFYTYSDQFGNVDIQHCAAVAQEKLGVMLPTDPFTLDQNHANALMIHGILPDIRELLTVVPLEKPKKKTRANPAKE